MLESKTVYKEVNLTISRPEMAHVWHSRMGHMSEKYMTMLREKDLLSGLGKINLDFCEHCVMGKNHQKAFGVGTYSSKEILEYIHSDVWGPSPVASLSGKFYYVSFIDDYLRYVWVYFLTLKSKVFATFKSWRARVETQTGHKVRYLRSDNGGEYTSKQFGLYCKEEGITRHLTTVYTPQQNIVAERLNRTVLEKVRSMLSQSSLPHKFWVEAVNTAVYLVNLSPSSAIDFKTLFELRHKRVADYGQLKIFGCTAYPLIPSENRSKLDLTSKKCCFLEYASGVKSYKLWDTIICKIIVSRDIHFNEPRSLNEGEIA